MSEMILKKEHFYSNQKHENREQLFEFAYQQLLSEGYVKQSFLEALVTREKQFPTGIETTINFAIPHAELENVNDSTFMVFTLDKPIGFNSMIQPEKQIGVSVVILLVLKEKKEHLSFLTKVMSIFQKSDEVIEILKQDSQKQYEFFKRQFELEENV